MRTDVKVGLICVFAVILGVVIYYVAQGNAHPTSAMGAQTSSERAGGTGTTPNVAGLDLAAAPMHSNDTPTASPLSGVSAAAAPAGSPVAVVVGASHSELPNIVGQQIAAGPVGDQIGTPSVSPVAPVAPAAPGSGGGPRMEGTTPGGLVPAGGGPTGGMPIDVSPMHPLPEGTPTFDTRPVPPTPTRSLSGPTSSTPPTGASTYKIQKGDMLGAIAKKFNVSVGALEEANKGVDPSKLQIGKTLNIPATGTGMTASTKPATTKPAAAVATGTRHPGVAAGTVGTVATVATTPSGPAKPGETYTVKKGDTLSTIAASAYGNKNQWQKIFQANRSAIADANVVPVGTVLHLP